MIYFVENLENFEIKIGFSSSPLDRKHQLELENERPRTNRRISANRARSLCRLAMLFYAEGDMKLEKELHAHCAQFRMHGEWFSAEVISRVAEWCLNNYIQHRLAAHEIIWSLATKGFNGVRLGGEVVWRGQRCSLGKVYSDISGARLSVTTEDVQVFAREIQVMQKMRAEQRSKREHAALGPQ